MTVWTGWKTYLASFLMAFVGALAEKGDVALVDAVVNPSQGKALIASALVMACMRWVTGLTTVKQALYSDPPKPDPNAPPKG